MWGNGVSVGDSGSGIYTMLPSVSKNNMSKAIHGLKNDTMQRWLNTQNSAVNVIRWYKFASK